MIISNALLCLIWNKNRLLRDESINNMNIVCSNDIWMLTMVFLNFLYFRGNSTCSAFSFLCFSPLLSSSLRFSTLLFCFYLLIVLHCIVHVCIVKIPHNKKSYIVTATVEKIKTGMDRMSQRGKIFTWWCELRQDRRQEPVLH